MVNSVELFVKFDLSDSCVHHSRSPPKILALCLIIMCSSLPLLCFVDAFLYLDLMVAIFLEHIKDMFYYLVQVFFIGNIKNSSCNSNDDANLLCRMIVRFIIEISISMCLLSIKLMGHRDIIFLRSQDIQKKVVNHFLLFPY